METFDVVVIGAGPAGYVAAIRCAQLGMKTACIDDFVGKSGAYALGGTCLNVGCIPSKALLESSEHYHDLQHGLAEHGIRVDKVTLDVPGMIRRKDKIVKTLTGGIAGLFKKNGVTWIPGRGRLDENLVVRVTDPVEGREERQVTGGHLVLATGSIPREIPNAEIDGDRICDSSHALDFPAPPARLGIIGAGVIGLELGSVWKRLGSEVVLLEAMDTFLPFVDEEVARMARKAFTAQGLDIRLGTRVLSAAPAGDGVAVAYRDGEGDHELAVDKLIVAVGRRARTQGLGLKSAGILLDEHGNILVNDYCRTNLPTVYAIGDAVRGPMLAHKGSEEGVMVAERIAGQQTHVNYDTIPWVVYTDPEIAWVGKTERELRAAAVPYTTGVFPLSANGRARAMNTPTGMVKVIAHRDTDRILGVHVFAPTASEMIAEAVVAMEFAASAEDLARIVHAHPTLSEAVHEAALAVDGRPLHI